MIGGVEMAFISLNNHDSLPKRAFSLTYSRLSIGHLMKEVCNNIGTNE